jgi:polyisoprenoid-binding protein YceI
MAWQIDTSHSQVEFSVRHMMISNVRGRFESLAGTVEFDEANPARSTVDVQIEAASVNTRDPRRDGHLKSPDFFDAEQYPYLTFKSKRVVPETENTGKIVGDLTIRGVTREVVLDVYYSGLAKSPWGTTSAGFSAETRISRKDWGLNWNQALETGGMLVGDEIRIAIELEVVRQEAPAEAVATA